MTAASPERVIKKVVRDARAKGDQEATRSESYAEAFPIKMFSDPETTKILHLQPGTLAKWRDRGKPALPFVRVGARIFYLEKDLEEFLLKTRRVDPAATD
jgi:hypothetical protein